MWIIWWQLFKGCPKLTGHQCGRRAHIIWQLSDVIIESVVNKKWGGPIDCACMISNGWHTIWAFVIISDNIPIVWSWLMYQKGSIWLPNYLLLSDSCHLHYILHYTHTLLRTIYQPSQCGHTTLSQLGDILLTPFIGTWPWTHPTRRSIDNSPWTHPIHPSIGTSPWTHPTHPSICTLPWTHLTPSIDTSPWTPFPPLHWHITLATTHPNIHTSLWTHPTYPSIDTSPWTLPIPPLTPHLAYLTNPSFDTLPWTPNQTLHWHLTLDTLHTPPLTPHQGHYPTLHWHLTLDTLPIPHLTPHLGHPTNPSIDTSPWIPYTSRPWHLIMDTTRPSIDTLPLTTYLTLHWHLTLDTTHPSIDTSPCTHFFLHHLLKHIILADIYWSIVIYSVYRS